MSWNVSLRIGRSVFLSWTSCLHDVITCKWSKMEIKKITHFIEVDSLRSKDGHTFICLLKALEQFQNDVPQQKSLSHQSCHSDAESSGRKRGQYSGWMGGADETNELSVILY